MKYVEPGEVHGIAPAPSSKSMMQRCLAVSALASGESKVLRPSFCDDALAAIGVCRALGAKVTVNGPATAKDTYVSVQGVGGAVGLSSGGTIDCSESGLSARMFTPIAALSPGEFTITGKGSLLSRPMEMSEAPLRALGVKIDSSSGKLPIRVTGPMKGGRVSVDGSVSSQFLSGLLISLPLCSGDSVVETRNLKSKEYVAMTLDAISRFGGKISEGEQGVFEVRGNQKYRSAEVEVEGDWSGAAFLLVAGAIAGKVEATNLNMASHQPDRKILEALRLSGAKLETKAGRKGNGKVTVEAKHLEGFAFDATGCPDLFPPLASLACSCKGTTTITGAQRLAHKESDRAAALVQEFSKMGASIKVKGDTMEIIGGKQLRGGTISSHNDHRIAMACAVAGLASEKGASIEGEECVSKSFPEFFSALEGLRPGR